MLRALHPRSSTNFFREGKIWQTKGRWICMCKGLDWGSKEWALVFQFYFLYSCCKSLQRSLALPSFTCIYHVLWIASCRESSAICRILAGCLRSELSCELSLEKLPCSFKVRMFKMSFRSRVPQAEKHHHWQRFLWCQPQSSSVKEMTAVLSRLTVFSFLLRSLLCTRWDHPLQVFTECEVLAQKCWHFLAKIFRAWTLSKQDFWESKISV